MRKYIGMFIIVALCDSVVANVITSGTITAVNGTVAKGDAGDLFQNATITADSGAHPNRNIADLFSQGSPVVAEDMIFADLDGDTLSFVDFHISSAASLTNIVIGLGNDFYAGPTNDRRSISNVKFYASTSAGTVLGNLIADIAVNPEYTDTYGGKSLQLSIDLPGVNAQYFRMEFLEPTIPPYLDRGARVIEIDAYAIPEPATLGILMIASGGLLGVRRLFMM